MGGVPVGMYIHGNSAIHRMLPELKLLLFAEFIFAVFLSDSLLDFCGLAIVLLWGTFLSKLKLRQVFGLVLKLCWFFVVIFLMNALFYRTQENVNSETVWFTWRFLKISKEGLFQGFCVVFRTVMILVAGTIYTSTTSPVQIIESLQWGMIPLAYLRVPVRQIAVIFSAAIQFIPTLYEETDMIKKAQIARGARFERRGLIAKATGVLPMVLPVFVVSFRRADELALAMESRGYSAGSRRSRQRVVFGVKEWGLFLLGACAVVGIGIL